MCGCVSVSILKFICSFCSSVHTHARTHARTGVDAAEQTDKERERRREECVCGGVAGESVRAELHARPVSVDGPGGTH